MTTVAQTYQSNATLAQVAQRLGAASHVTVVTHTKPDGDAMGSCLAMHRALAARGIDCEVWLMGPVDDALADLGGSTPFQVVDQAAGRQPGNHSDVIVIVDTGAWSQLEELDTWLRANHEKIIGIDHHPRGDDVAAMRYIDSSAGSTTLILLELFDELGVPITGGQHSIAEALFVGLATDTGWFKYENADHRVFAAAARLLEAGVNKSALYQSTDESYEPRRLDLEARALASLEYLDSGRVALMHLTMDDFAQTGGSTLDLTGMVNMPMCVAAVRASILMTQSDPGIVKLSLRSKPVGNADDGFINVNELAQAFGGGGHVHAAGARIKGTITDARDQIREAIDNRS